MKLTFTSDKRNVAFVPETTAEETILTMFPAFIKSRGQRLVPSFPHILQNVLKRLKTKLKLPVTTEEKEIVDLLKREPTLLELPDFNFITTPLKHQLIALRYLYTNGGGGLLLDPGLGKTKVVLDYIKLMGFKKSLIVCPVALKFVWVDEVATHRPDLKIHVLESTTWDSLFRSAQVRYNKWKEEDDKESTPKTRTNLRKAELDLERIPELAKEDLEAAEEADVIVINYHKAVTNKDAAKAKILTGADYLLHHFDFNFIALDEALIKGPHSERTLNLLKMGSQIPYRVIMSGTLVNNTALDAFAPIRFLHPSLVGGAFGRFDFYYSKKVQFGRNGPMVTVSVPEKSIREIREILESCSIVMRKEDWLDLPEKKFHPVPVPLSQIQREMYSELVSNRALPLPNGEVVAVDNGLALMAKVSQISNGFLYYREEVDDFLDILFGGSKTESSRQTFFFEENPKIKKLEEMLGKELSGKKFILWYNFSAEHDMICDFLTSKGISHLVVRGGTKDTGDQVRKFNTEEYQVLVCQAKAVNYGITVLGKDPENLDTDVEILPDFSTKVFTHVFYSLNYSLEVYLQQQDRSHRIGQTLPVDYYILLGDCESEYNIYDALQAKMNIRESVLVDFSRRLKPLV